MNIFPEGERKKRNVTGAWRHSIVKSANRKMAQWMIFSLCRIILTAAADVTEKYEEIQEATADEKTEERKWIGYIPDREWEI